MWQKLGWALKGGKWFFNEEEVPYGPGEISPVEEYLYGRSDVIPEERKKGRAPTPFGWESVPAGAFMMPPEGGGKAPRAVTPRAVKPPTTGKEFPFLAKEGRYKYAPPARWLLY